MSEQDKLADVFYNQFDGMRRTTADAIAAAIRAEIQQAMQPKPSPGTDAKPEPSCSACHGNGTVGYGGIWRECCSCTKPAPAQPDATGPGKVWPEVVHIQMDGEKLTAFHIRTISGQPYISADLHARELASRDEQIRQLQDHPEYDGTDFAHTAWWRGHKSTADLFCEKINKLLDGEETAGACKEPWQSVRLRICQLQKRLQKTESERDAAQKEVQRLIALDAENAGLRGKLAEMSEWLKNVHAKLTETQPPLS